MIDRKWSHEWNIMDDISSINHSYINEYPLLVKNMNILVIVGGCKKRNDNDNILYSNWYLNQW